ncbi:MAG: hypothetical protein ACM3YE_01180 [Bacteroidota bacterium]
MEQFEKDCQQLHGKNPPPVLLSFSTDPYQPIDEELAITREAIRLLHKYGLVVEDSYQRWN